VKRFFTPIRFSTASRCLSMLAVLIASQAVPAAADQAQALVGAQSRDLGKQALAFLPNELWVYVGDSITWTFDTDEIHTVTFLKPGQIRTPNQPPNQAGCPGTTPDGSSYNGTACVNSGPLVSGQSYSVSFPSAGNFKLVCLIHVDMTGAVHVLNPSETLPYDQAFYNREARNERAELLSDASRLEGRGIATAQRTSENEVAAGISEIVATTGGGVHTATVMRFLRGTTVVRVGDTVEWTNLGPVVPHTVTFGIEPANLMPPSAGVTVDSDGARHAIIGSPTDNVNSGFLIAAPQERVGLAQSPLAVTRFRVTFTSPGTFNYICGLHDDLGMVGTVIVHP
jgi:plastocyanin